MKVLQGFFVFLLIVSAVPAWANEANMSCRELAHEEYKMRQIVEKTTIIQTDSTGEDLGMSAAGAVGSIVLGPIGGLGIAAAGLIMDEESSSQAAEMQATNTDAAQRRGFIMGVYAAKGCNPAQDYAHPQAAEKLAAIEPSAASKTLEWGNPDAKKVQNFQGYNE